MDAEEGLARQPLTRRDAAAAALAFAAALALYAATAQERIYGHDGAFLVNAFATGLEGHSNSALYATLSGWMGALWPRTSDPTAPLLALSALGGAGGVGAVYLIARASGSEARGAALATALFALAPAQWFFATAIETHGLHVGAVGLAALVCLFGPWRRPLVARLCAAAVFPLMYLTHMTALLLAPGWPLLARLGRLRARGPAREAASERRESWFSDLLGTGIPLAFAILFAVAAANFLFGAGFRLFVREESPGRFLEQFTRRFPLEVFWSGFALALFLLLPLAAWALAAGRPRGPARAALVALAGVPALVLLWLGIPERGAYFLGSAPFLAALSAHAPLPAGARGWALAGVLALLQGIAGRGELERFDRMFPLGERIEVVRAHLGEHGVLLTINPNVPRTSAFLPGVIDYDLALPLVEHEAAGRSPEEFAAFLEGEIRRVFPAQPVALDLSHRHVYEEPPELQSVVRFEPYLIALERRLESSFETRLVSHAWWPLLVLER